MQSGMSVTPSNSNDTSDYAVSGTLNFKYHNNDVSLLTPQGSSGYYVSLKITPSDFEWTDVQSIRLTCGATTYNGIFDTEHTDVTFAMIASGANDGGTLTVTLSDNTTISKTLAITFTFGLPIITWPAQDYQIDGTEAWNAPSDEDNSVVGIDMTAFDGMSISDFETDFAYDYNTPDCGVFNGVNYMPTNSIDSTLTAIDGKTYCIMQINLPQTTISSIALGSGNTFYSSYLIDSENTHRAYIIIDCGTYTTFADYVSHLNGQVCVINVYNNGTKVASINFYTSE